tara:strand:+ start:846 stop:1211 length:366 start_codon:yes stop_codon:yes gene_type:complete
MSRDDLRAEILRFSTSNGHPAVAFESLVCACGHEKFTLFSDDRSGGAVAVCTACEENISIYDSADFMEEVAQNVCACDHEVLYLMTGMAHYPDSDDVQWVYVGATCAECDLAGVYVDWKEQ